MIRVNINDPNIVLRDKPTNWGGGVWLYNGELFTGIMYEYFPNSTQLYAETEYKNGIIDGRQLEYWGNGKLKEEYFEKYDAIVGSFKVWNEQGILISHNEYDQFGKKQKTII